jgi:aliphatic nitrilase
MWPFLGPPAWAGPHLMAHNAACVERDSPLLEPIYRAARDNAITVVLGYAERDHGTLYIAQQTIGPDGELIHARRKLKPTHLERSMFGEGDGTDIAVHQLPWGRLGALNCWEHIQPLVKFAMFSQHEEVHAGAWPSLSLHLDPPEAAYAFGPAATDAINRTYALEGQCFVVAATSVMTPEIQAQLADTDERREWLTVGGGHAAIYAPDGRSIGNRLAPDEEGLVLAELDLSLVTAAKMLADPIGHYARGDVLQLVFNRAPRRAVLPPGADGADPVAAPQAAAASASDADVSADA